MSTSETMGLGVSSAPAKKMIAREEERRELDAPEIGLPQPQSRADERYRLIAVRLEHVLERRNGVEQHGPHPLGKLVLVTSAQRGDGKTTTALHVGVALSRALGRRVAVVDADLERPGLAPMLGLGSGRGLSEVLEGSASLDDVLVRGEDGGPLLVPAGGPANHGRPGALLPVLNTLREYNDIVLVDCAAMQDSADAAILGRAADGVVLVVRAGATREESLVEALDGLIDAPLVGVVLNDHDGAGGPTMRRVGRPTVWEEDD
jgi:Mrp family chromosome partitioning ATPase